MKLSRALAKKVIRLSLLGTSTLGLLVSSGISFAKYYSENGFNDGADVAKMGVRVLYNDNSVQLPQLRASSDLGYYAFINTFRLDFNECDVKCNYSLSLKLGNVSDAGYDNVTSLNDTSFILSGTVPVVNSFNSVSGSKEKAPLNEWNTNFTSYSINTLYYATSNDGVNYTWNRKTNHTSYNQVDLVSNIKMDFSSRVHYYKVMFFVEFTYEDISHESLEQSRLFYNIDVEQEAS